jgi:hypothetical protein
MERRVPVGADTGGSLGAGGPQGVSHNVARHRDLARVWHERAAAKSRHDKTSSQRHVDD